MTSFCSLISSAARAALIGQLAWATLIPLSAQADVYKHVAPDGTVTFSDTPPLSTPAQTLRQPARNAPTAAPSPARSATAGTQPTAPLSAQEAFFRNATLGAAVKLRTVSVLIDRISQFCEREQPQAAAAVRAARTQWHRQHDPLMPVIQQILNDLAPAQLRGEQSRQLQAAADEQLHPLQAANKTEQLRRCQRASTDFEGSAMNLAGSPAVLNLFKQYKPGRWTSN